MPLCFAHQAVGIVCLLKAAGVTWGSLWGLQPPDWVGQGPQGSLCPDLLTPNPSQLPTHPPPEHPHPFPLWTSSSVQQARCHPLRSLRDWDLLPTPLLHPRRLMPSRRQSGPSPKPLKAPPPFRGGREAQRQRGCTQGPGQGAAGPDCSRWAWSRAGRSPALQAAPEDMAESPLFPKAPTFPCHKNQVNGTVWWQGLGGSF